MNTTPTPTAPATWLGAVPIRRALVGLTIAAIGSFLPWAHVLGFVDFGGSAVGGQYTFIGAALAALVIWKAQPGTAKVLTVILSVLGSLWMLLLFAAIVGEPDVTVGIGVYVTFAGFVSAFVSACKAKTSKPLPVFAPPVFAPPIV